MPNLITILHRPSTETKRQTEEERRRELVEVLGKGGEKNGMEWGTCLVFSCLKDCCAGDEREADARDCWREEIVLVQWEE
jgi:pre-rRNA-processing protein TSR4